jgi:rhodanese-related sulfurtransferase
MLVGRKEPEMKTVGRLQDRNRLRWIALLAVTIMLVSPAIPSEAGAGQTEPSSSQLPTEKQTTLGRYLTAREAFEKWKAESMKPIIVDVRTPEEFLFVGHADMAWNVPVAAQSYVWDSTTRQFPMRLLPDFVSRVEQIANSDNTLLVMCRSGARSAQAVELLVRAGFQNVYNITDGFEGDLVDDPNSVFHGQRLVNGWKNSGLPWTYDVDPKRMLLPSSR